MRQEKNGKCGIVQDWKIKNEREEGKDREYKNNERKQKKG